MGWDVINGIKKYKQITWMKLLGQTIGTATDAKVLLKDNDGNAIIARLDAGAALPQKKRGFAKGCLLLLQLSGPSNQNTHGLYENVGTALLSRFNIIGQVVDPEIILAQGKVLVGNTNGLARAVDLSGGLTIDEDGVVTLVPTDLDLTDGSVWIGDGTGKAAEQTVSGVISMTNGGVTAFNPLYANTHRIIAAGISEAEVDADSAVVITNAAIDDQDVVLATLAAATNAVYVTKAAAAVGSATVTLSGNGGAGTQVAYVVLRPVNALAPTTTPPTTAPPTTLAPTTEAPTTAI